MSIYIFTHQEQTVKKHSIKQAYAQAAMVLRGSYHIAGKIQFTKQIEWYYDPQDDNISLSLYEFSDIVERILSNYIHHHKWELSKRR